MPFGFLTLFLVALNSISTQTVLGDATHWSAGEQEVNISCSRTCKFTEGFPYELNCEVLSPSNLTSIEWYHNGEMFNRTSVTSSSTSNYRVVLYLKNISAAEGGIYSCQALYVNESKMSNEISVTVQYSPVCVDDERNEYFHNEKELQIFCNVKSNPPPIANEYRWEINTTTGIQRLRDEMAASITYSIPNTPPFGTLFCGAFNGIGDQEKKCVIRVLKATLPDPVHDCQKNKSYADGAIRITCQTGSDGGLTANFSLVVQSLDTGDIVYQNTSTSPHFIVTGLVTGQYSITLKAINSVGAQSFSEVYNHTTSDNGISSEIISPYDLVFIVAVIVAVFILIIAVLAVFIYKRRRRAAGADETRIPMNRNPTDTLESHPNSQPEHQPLNPQD